MKRANLCFEGLVLRSLRMFLAILRFRGPCWGLPRTKWGNSCARGSDEGDEGGGGLRLAGEGRETRLDWAGIQTEHPLDLLVPRVILVMHQFCDLDFAWAESNWGGYILKCKKEAARKLRTAL